MKRHKVKSHWRKGRNGPELVHGHARGGFSPHPERFQGRTPRKRKPTSAEPISLSPVLIVICITFLIAIFILAVS